MEKKYSRNKKIKNPVNNTTNVKNIKTDNDKFMSDNIIMDFSFKGLFLSNSENNKFDNYLKNAEDFSLQFKKLHKNVILLSKHSMNELLRNHKHCHSVKDEEEDKLKFIIKKYFDNLKIQDMQYIQEIDQADMYQLGEQDSIRFYGTIIDNIFKVYLIDYFHTLYDDEKYNVRNKRNYKYTVMELEDLNGI